MYKMGSKFEIDGNKMMLVASPDFKLVAVCPEDGFWYFQLELKNELYTSEYSHEEILNAYSDQYGTL